MYFMHQGLRQEFKNIKLRKGGTMVKVRRLSQDYVSFFIPLLPKSSCSRLGSAALNAAESKSCSLA